MNRNKPAWPVAGTGLVAVLCAFCALLSLSAAPGALAQQAEAQQAEAQQAEARSVQSDADFAALADKLNADSFEAKYAAARRLAELDHPRVVVLLEAMLAGELYERRADGRLAFVDRLESGYALTDAISGEALGEAKTRAVRKVSVNNPLRSQLKEIIARIRLNSADARVRSEAVREMFGSIDAASGALVRQALASESDVLVREQMEDALALLDLTGDDPDERRAAIERLGANVDPEVRSRLAGVRDDAQGDPEIRALAEASIKRIEAKLARYRMIETVFFGLSLGSVLVLAAIGLAITFGVMGVINMAHGELIMLGAYTTYVVQLVMPEQIEASVLVAIPMAFFVTAAVGIAIERGIIRFLYGRPLETLLATFGISLILQQSVRSIFSPLNRSVTTPQWMSGSLEVVSGLSFTYNRLFVLLFSLLLFFLLLLVMQRTSLGLQVRAVAQNRRMARAMGVRSNAIDALTFGLGSGIAGVAGVALSQLTNVGPNMGQSYIVDSFMVVVFGGVGNIWGTLVGGLTLGVANKFLEPFWGAVLAKILILIFIILFIQKRPRGLFPQKGRAAEG